MELKIRNARLKDTRFIYNLRNDIISRKHSLNKKKIKYKDHFFWLKKKINKKRDKIFIICNKTANKNIAYVRFDKMDLFTRVSIAIDKKFRGRGFSKNILSMAENQLNKVSILFAEVNKKNIASYKLFEKNNYVLLNKKKNFFQFIKILNKDHQNKIFMETIDRIQNTRKKNNVNWMDILRIAFTNSPKATSIIFKRITSCDNEINNLSKKLSK